MKRCAQACSKTTDNFAENLAGGDSPRAVFCGGGAAKSEVTPLARDPPHFGSNSHPDKSKLLAAKKAIVDVWADLLYVGNLCRGGCNFSSSLLSHA